MKKTTRAVNTARVVSMSGRLFSAVYPGLQSVQGILGSLEIGTDFDRLGIICLGLCTLTLFGIQKTAIKVRIGILGIETDGPVEVGKGMDEIPFVIIGQTAIVISDG